MRPELQRKFEESGMAVMGEPETDEILRDLKQRRRRNEGRKRQVIEIETAVRKLKVDWLLFQSEVYEKLGGSCNGGLRACRRILERVGLSNLEIAIVLSYFRVLGSTCDCEVFFNVDMTEPRQLALCDCVDCGADFDESYMVEDAVWAAGGLEPDGGKLCIGCLERRLGRKLKRDDFDFSKPVNEIDDWQSLRLRDRLCLNARPVRPL